MPHFRQAFSLGGLFAIALAFCAIFTPVSPALAQTAVPSVDPFTVHGLAVDVSDNNIAAAREKALLDGQRQAYVQVLQRLTAQSDWQRLPQVSDGDLQDMVLDVGIDQEKHSTVRYLATLSVRFKAEAVRRLLRTNGIPYAEWRGRPVVVLPVWQSDAGPVLYDPVNPWRDAWTSGAAQGVVPLSVMAQADPALPPLAGLASGDAGALTALTQRYAPQDVLLAVAQPQQQDGNKVKLTVTLYGQGPVAALVNGGRTYQGAANEPLDAVARRAVADVASALSNGWKSGNILRFDQQGALPVTVPLPGGLSDWVLLRDKLVRSTPVRSFEVVSLSKTEAHLILHYVGEQAQLESVCMQNGLALSWQDDHWSLQNAGGGVNTPAAVPAPAAPVVPAAPVPATGALPSDGMPPTVTIK